MPKKAGTFSYAKRGCRFTWEGGEYIDVAINGQPIEVINVYDYERGEVKVERTQVAFVAACEAWLKGIDGNAMQDYITAAREMKQAQ